MNFMSSVQIALTALRINALRTGLAMLGVIIGVASVIVLVSISEGTKAAVERQIASLGSNLLIIRPGSRAIGGRRGGAGSAAPLTDEDVVALRDEIDGIAGLSGEVSRSVNVVVGSVNWPTRIRGIEADYFEVRDWNIELGQGFLPDDISSGEKYAVIGQTIVDQVFDGADPIGLTLRIDNVPFEVVGTVESKGQTSFGSDQDDIVFAPLTTARRRLGAGRNRTVRNPVQTIYVEVSGGESIANVVLDIQDLLRIRRGIEPGAEDDFAVGDLAEFIRARNETESQLGLLLAVGAGIVLLVGGIGIMNIMLVSVTERTREIGLRLALGATPRDIRDQFLIESVILCLIGGLVGLMVGVSGTLIYAEVGQLDIVIEPMIIALAIGASAMVGVVFGLYPAHRASILNPIEALRFE